MNNWDKLIDKIYQTWYASLSWEEKDVEKYQAARAALRDAIAKVEQERDEYKAYSDKLAEGLPEGILPKDIENLRTANAKFAQDNFKLESALKAANDAANEMIRQWHIWGSQTAGQGLPTNISNSIAEYELVLQEHRARVAKDGE
jgi:cysteinyl-tRNA synthetase